MLNSHTGGSYVKWLGKFSFMEEWKTYTLSELSKGKGNYGIAASAVPYNPDLYTYLRITDINDDGTLNKSGMMSVDENNARDYLLKPNDIVFARTGNSTGRSYFYDGSDGELVFAGFLIRFSLDERKLNPRILKYYTHSKPYYDWVKSFDTGGTRGNINAKTYGEMPIVLPLRTTQDRVVEVMKSLDDKIEVNQRINDNLDFQTLLAILDRLSWLKRQNDNLEKQAQALFQSFFIDFECFKDGEFEESELGVIPKGWCVKELGEVTKQQNTKVKDRTDVKVLSPVTSGELVLSEEYFTKQVFSESIAKYIVVKPLDFAYNPARVNIGSLGMNSFGFDGCVSPVYVVFRCEEGYHHFFDLFRQTEKFKEEVKSRAIGGVRQTLGYKDFSMIKVVYPPQEVLEEFNGIYSKLLAEIEKNKKEMNRLGSIRDTLLPKLMSGEIKVSEMKA